MSEAPAEAVTPDANADPEAPAKETDWKAEARKWEERAKANKGAAERLAEIEEASKTEAQKLAERAEAAERALAEAQAEATRLSVIAKYAISADYHEFVVGSTEEELSAKAEKVQKLIEAQGAAAVPARHAAVPGEGSAPAIALNGDGIESALKNALGIQ